MTGTARFIFKFSVMAALLLGLPLVGVMLAGYPAARYFEFPPRSRYVVHAPYSGWIFTAHLIFILVITGPLVVRAWQGRQKKTTHHRGRRSLSLVGLGRDSMRGGLLVSGMDTPGLVRPLSTPYIHTFMVVLHRGDQRHRLPSLGTLHDGEPARLFPGAFSHQCDFLVVL